MQVSVAFLKIPSSQSDTTTVSSVYAPSSSVVLDFSCRVPLIVISSLAVAGVHTTVYNSAKKKKKIGRLHSNTQSHPLPACCLEPILLCACFEMGCSKKEEQRTTGLINIDQRAELLKLHVGYSLFNFQCERDSLAPSIMHFPGGLKR